MNDSNTFLVERKNEEATRQRGGLFSRENSSNGGKAIRTFWRNTKFGKNRCQGLNSAPISRYLGISYELSFSLITTHKFALYSLFGATMTFKQPCNQCLSFAAALVPVQSGLKLCSTFLVFRFTIHANRRRLPTQIDPQKLGLCGGGFALQYPDSCPPSTQEQSQDDRRQRS
jgi:hypothetical protein